MLRKDRTGGSGQWVKRWVAGILLGMVFVVEAEPKWGDPAGFFTQEDIVSKEIQPGLRCTSASGYRDGVPLRSYLLDVDLGGDHGLNLQALTGGTILNREAGHFVRRATVSQMMEASDALGAINVAFFNIANTQASQGIVMRAGELLREPQQDRPALLVFNDGSLSIASPDWAGRVHSGNQRRPLAGINRPVLDADDVVLYRAPWSWSPGGNSSFTKGGKVTEILLDSLSFTAAAGAGEVAILSGEVVKIRSEGKPFEIKKNQVVISAGESAAPFFRQTKTGDKLTLDWTLSGLPASREWQTLREAVAAQPVLVKAGEKASGDGAFWNSRHPRSAVAVDQTGKRAILVVVDGRSKESVGMSLHTLTDYLLHLGAHDALNFDGGGSSAIGVRKGRKAEILNRPSDGRERPVPTALGVFKKA